MLVHFAVAILRNILYIQDIVIHLYLRIYMHNTCDIPKVTAYVAVNSVHIIVRFVGSYLM